MHLTGSELFIEAWTGTGSDVCRERYWGAWIVTVRLAPGLVELAAVDVAGGWVGEGRRRRTTIRQATAKRNISGFLRIFNTKLHAACLIINLFEHFFSRGERVIIFWVDFHRSVIPHFFL